MIENERITLRTHINGHRRKSSEQFLLEIEFQYLNQKSKFGMWKNDFYWFLSYPNR